MTTFNPTQKTRESLLNNQPMTAPPPPSLTDPRFPLFLFAAPRTPSFLQHRSTVYLFLLRRPSALLAPTPFFYTVHRASPSQNGAVDSKVAANGHVPPDDRCITPVLPDIMDPTVCYFPNAYYYGGYDGTCNEWDDYSRYMNQEGMEMQPAVYGDNSAFMYHGYGYAPYGPYSPTTSPTPPPMGHDNQLYAAH